MRTHRTASGLFFTDRDFYVTLLDINEKAVETVNAKKILFLEESAEALLQKHIDKNLYASTDSGIIKTSDIVIFVIDPPVDEHFNPNLIDCTLPRCSSVRFPFESL